MPDSHNMCSYALDIWTNDVKILTDADRLTKIMKDAAEKGNALVLGSVRHTFPNGAVTGVLVLSQSHLSVHTWPEYKLANFDLLTCGVLDGELIIARLMSLLAPAKSNLTRVVRSTAPVATPGGA